MVLTLSVLLTALLPVHAGEPAGEKRQAIEAVVASYQRARETGDTVLLKSILTEQVDQLVSTGEWRTGLDEAMQGMQRSSAGNPGTRTLTVERVRFLDSKNAIADARYVIVNPSGTARQMWSTFVVVQEQGRWKIAAIRNMLPSDQR